MTVEVVDVVLTARIVHGPHRLTLVHVHLTVHPTKPKPKTQMIQNSSGWGQRHEVAMVAFDGGPVLASSNIHEMNLFTQQWRI